MQATFDRDYNRELEAREKHINANSKGKNLSSFFLIQTYIKKKKKKTSQFSCP